MRDDALPDLVHELRQPLAALAMLVDVARRLPPGPEVGEVLDQIGAQAREAVEVTNRLARYLEAPSAADVVDGRR